MKTGCVFSFRPLYLPHVDRLLFICMQLTGGRIGDRLLAEAETNLAINVIPGMSESFEVQGRGELQLGLCFSILCSVFLSPV